MTHHTDTELLPCPFCGCEAHFEMDDDRWEWIECGSCGMQGNRSASLMEDCKPKLAEAWNRRAPVAPVPDVTDAMIEAANEAYCPFGDMHLAIQAALAAAPQPPGAEDLGKKLQDAQRRSDFFKRRCDLLQIVQRCMRDPERTLVCDVLANGHLLHDVDSEAGKARYLAPEAAPVQLPEPVAKIFFDRKGCEVSELPAWENLRPYGTHELVSVQQVRQLLANHGIQEQST